VEEEEEEEMLQQAIALSLSQEGQDSQEEMLTGNIVNKRPCWGDALTFPQNIRTNGLSCSSYLDWNIYNYRKEKKSGGPR
jgi:hypothetical protein